jgi:hypothetical protein
MKFETSIGKSTRDTIYNHGFNLSEDLIGKATIAWKIKTEGEI